MSLIKLDIWPEESKHSQLLSYSNLRNIFDLKVLKRIKGRPIFNKLHINYDFFESRFVEIQRRKNVLLLMMTHIYPHNLKPPYIVLFHDTIPWEPKWAYGVDPDKTYKGLFGDNDAIIKMTLRATKVITPSFYSKNKIVSLFNSLNYDIKDKIEVIPNFVDRKIFYPIEREKSKKGNYKILFVGTDNVRKNHINAIESLYLLKKIYKIDAEMTVVTAKRRRFQEIRNTIDIYSLNEKIKWLTFVELQQLVEMYRTYDLFLFPSYEEGFGIPIIEAQACGLPVVASNVSCIPEVAGKGALFVDPYDPSSIAEGIFRVLTDDELRNSIVSEGFKNVNNYTEDKYIERIRNLVQKVYEEMNMT
ncbi:MAG: glycosyltransferase family 4 protein [Athalassotoga sp.]